MPGCCSQRSLRLARANTRKATAAANKAVAQAQRKGVKPKKASAKKATAKKATPKKADCRVCAKKGRR